MLTIKRVLLIFFVSISSFTNVFSQAAFSTIKLIFPKEDHRFKNRDVISVQWTPFQYFVGKEIDVTYAVKAVVVEEGQSSTAAIERNEPIYFRKFTMPAVSNGINVGERLDDTGSFPPQSVIAWQVSATGVENDKEYTDISPISTFKTHLLVENLFAAGHRISIIDSNKDFQNFSGTCFLSFLYNLPEQRLVDTLYSSFEAVSVLTIGGISYLDGGEIRFDLKTPASIPFYFDNIQHTLQYGKLTTTREGIFVDAKFSASVPLKGNIYQLSLANERSLIRISTGGWLFGTVPINEQVFALGDSGFDLKIYDTSLAIVDQSEQTLESTYRFVLNVGYSLPGIVTKFNGDAHYFNTTGLMASSSAEEAILFKEASWANDTLQFIPGTGLSFVPTAGHIDLSDKTSADGADPQWKGIRFSAVTLYYPNALGELTFIGEQVKGSLTAGSNYSVSPEGHSASFSHPFSLTPVLAALNGDTIILKSAHYGAYNSTIANSFIEGDIKQSFFNPNGLYYGFKYFLTDQGWGHQTSFTIGEYEFMNTTPLLSLPIETRAHHVVLSWPAVEGATSYLVSVSQDYFNTTLENYDSLEVTEPTLLVEGLAADTAYQYSVRPVVPGKETYFSYPIEFATAIEVPEAPQNLTLYKRTNVAYLDWSDTQTEEGYIIERISEDGETFAFADSLGQNSISYFDTINFSLDPIAYRLAAYNAGGQGPYSTIVSVKTGTEHLSLEPIGVKLYPNPASEKLQIVGESRVWRVVISAINGQSFDEFALHNISGTVELDIRHLPLGLYIISIELENGANGYGRFIKD